ncbi:MAG: Uma2 family endonuclease [Dehalococcoidia bacterium]|nr:Uma2 family endonuclease [Dehalococcoidia bacterium]
MTTTREKLLTADDLLRLHSEGVRGELIMGVLHETVSNGLEHGEVVVNLASEFHGFVRPRRLGRVAGSDSGIQLERDPDTVREPDIAFISADRLPLDVRVRGYSQVVPDLVVEVVSPSDRPAPVYDKAQMWLRFGVRLVLVVDPETRSILALPSEGSARTFAENDTLDCGDVLPGFSCPVRNIFDT